MRVFLGGIEELFFWIPAAALWNSSCRLRNFRVSIPCRTCHELCALGAAFRASLGMSAFGNSLMGDARSFAERGRP